MNNVLPWYIGGPLIGLIVPLLLLFRDKQFGITSSYRYIGSKNFKKLDYFNYNSEVDKWQFQFAFGLILAGIFSIYSGLFQTETYVSQSADYSIIASTIYDSTNSLFFFIGGILVGFGARYANGCTAGHCIMGVSQFSISSIVATVCFFIGGLFASYILIPLVF